MLEVGRVRALAVSNTERLPTIPDVPTFAESGFPQYNTRLWFGLLAPAHTASVIQQKLAREVAEFVKKPEIVSRFAALGFTPRSSMPDEFARLGSNEINQWTEVAEFASISPQ